jgi:D-alanyl-D-alanine carboxypeptidase
MSFALLALLAVQAPPFAYTVSPVTRAQLPHSWHLGCPVAPSALRRVRLTYWGFDGQAHTGAVVVNESAVRDIVIVFRRVYAARFPIRRMRPIDAYSGSDERSLAADNTAAFNCRYAVGPGPRRWSTHAYGLAIDVNPVENPYLEGGVVRPPGGRAYLDRTRVRPGMAAPRGALVQAFATAGWKWGGRWAASPDYQHFSATGG